MNESKSTKSQPEKPEKTPPSKEEPSPTLKEKSKEAAPQLLATAKGAAKAVPVGRTGSSISSESKQSIQSVGIAGSASKRKNQSNAPLLIPEGPEVNPESRVSDVIVFLIHCPEHDKIAVTNVDRARCVWLPYCQMSDTRTWKKTVDEVLEIIVGNRDTEQDAKDIVIPVMEKSYFNVLRVQLPNERFISRLSVTVSLKKTEGFTCCKTTPRIHWIRTVDIIANRVDKMWGPEVRELTIAHSTASKFEDIFTSYPLKAVIDTLIKQKSWEYTHLKANSVTTRSMIAVYEDFLEHSFPALFMCFENFRTYMIKKGFKGDTDLLANFFYGFSYKGNSHLDFQELIIGLTAIDPTNVRTTEGRGKLIFRYYDSSKSGMMEIDDFVAMQQDIAQASGKTETDEELQKRVEAAILLVGLRNNKIPLDNFLIVFKQKKMPGIEKICLAPDSFLLKLLNTRSLTRVRSNKNQEKDLSQSSKNAAIENCARCKIKKYDWCAHQVTVDCNGRTVEPKIMNSEWIQRCEGGDMNSHKHSIELSLGSNSFAWIIMDMIREFHKQRFIPGPNGQKPKGLMAKREDYTILSKYINMVSSAILGILAVEQKLQKIRAPAIVVGDVQGSLSDLMILDKHYVHTWPVLSTNLVFLGNYSGVIPLGIECILYLFSLKIATPNKVFLLRGANETTSENQHFLKKECYKKYGEKLGRKIYDTINKVFERLPIAGVIDETIFCVSSGIPRKSKLQKFLKLPLDLNQPAKNAPDAWELMVNTPQPVFERLSAAKSEAKEYIKAGGPLALKKKNQNNQMGTKLIDRSSVNIPGFSPIQGQLAYQFNDKAFNTFMSEYGYKYMIRSHTPIPDDGYDLSFDYRCISIFNCTNYLRYLRRYQDKGSKAIPPEVGMFEPTNPCTVAMVDYFLNRIRIIQMGSATKLKPDPEMTIRSDPGEESSEG